MKHIKKINETKGKESLKYVKIFKPKGKDLDRLSNIILSTFDGCEVTIKPEGIITVTQDGKSSTGSVMDWILAIADTLELQPEKTISLFFWQGNNPVDDLYYMIQNKR